MVCAADDRHGAPTAWSSVGYWAFASRASANCSSASVRISSVRSISQARLRPETNTRSLVGAVPPIPPAIAFEAASTSKRICNSSSGSTLTGRSRAPLEWRKTCSVKLESLEKPFDLRHGHRALARIDDPDDEERVITDVAQSGCPEAGSDEQLPSPLHDG